MKVRCDKCDKTAECFLSDAVFKCECGNSAYIYVPDKRFYDLNTAAY